MIATDEYEKERLAELASYDIMDTLEEVDYDNLTTIAAQICETKISLITLVDEKRQWFKSRHGLNAKESSKNHAFCAHAVHNDYDVLIVPDARKDERFSSNPIVQGDPNIAFYAGVTLVSNGMNLGTICVLDDKPKELSENQIKALQALSEQIMRLLELRKKKNQLDEAIDSLKQKNQEVEQFAYLAAHDLKSPLHNINSLTNLLLDDDQKTIDPEQKRLIEMIASASNNLGSLVDGLLDHSRSDGNLTDKKSTIDTSSLKQDIETLLAIDETTQINLITQLDRINVNKQALHQILLNIVSNAIKYGDKEITMIDIGIEEASDKYHFYVKDNGPGIAPKDHGKIFEMFGVIVSEDRYGKSNSGIGLATVKKIVEQQGGTIEVNSNLGDGAKFTFTIAK